MQWIGVRSRIGKTSPRILHCILVALAMAVGLFVFCLRHQPEMPAVESERTQDRSLSVGMRMADVTVLLKSLRVPIIEEELGDVVVEDASAHWYLVRPLYESKDALMIQAAPRGAANDLHVMGMQWYLNYDDDSATPKAFRSRRLLELQAIPISILLPGRVQSRQ